MISVGKMIEQLEELLGTKDLTDWETKFVKGITERYNSNGKRTVNFSIGQLEMVERIWEKHFAG